MFDYLAAGTGRVDLLENTVVYLMAFETPPDGSISGRVCLEGEGDHSGITVTLTPGGDVEYTDAGGRVRVRWAVRRDVHGGGDEVRVVGEPGVRR